jgi:hypothetical protein
MEKESKKNIRKSLLKLNKPYTTCCMFTGTCTYENAFNLCQPMSTFWKIGKKK